MRTTVEFDDDVTKAIERLRRQRGLGVSEAVNELIRRGLLLRDPARPFRQTTAAAGLKIDVTKVADALAVLEGDQAR